MENILKIKLILLTIIFYHATGFLSTAQAIQYPLRTAEGLRSPVEERAYLVKNAKVIVADYDAIRRDFQNEFPFLATATPIQTNEWLVKNAAYLAESQIKKGETAGIHSKLNIDEDSVIMALRPLFYGRTLVLQLGKTSFIEVKGAGTVEPSLGFQKDGALPLETALYEFMVEKIVRSAVKKAQRNIDTIRSYAVIDLDFDLKSRKHVVSPFLPSNSFVTHSKAGLLLRQAHVRAIGFFPDRAEEIENILNRNKINSGRTRLQRRIDLEARNEVRNLQGQVANGKDGDALVDFETYSVANLRNFIFDPFFLRLTLDIGPSDQLGREILSIIKEVDRSNHLKND